MAEVLTKLVTVFIVLTVLCSNIRSQLFCDSFVENEHKVLIYSDRDIKEIILIIGSKYWLVDINDTHMWFRNEDKPKEILDSEETDFNLAIGLINWLSTKRTSFFAFYEPKTGEIYLIKRQQNTMTFINMNQTVRSAQVLSNISVAFIVNENTDRPNYNGAVNGLVSQTFDNKINQYKRRIDFYMVHMPNETSIEFYHCEQLPNFMVFNDSIEILKFNGDKQLIGVAVIGVHQNKISTVFGIYRNNSAILYCQMNECSDNNLSLLVDCQTDIIIPDISDKRSDSFVFIVLIGSAALILVILLVICFGYVIGVSICGLKKASQKPEEEKSQKSSDNISIYTVDSTTGWPIEKPEKSISKRSANT